MSKELIEKLREDGKFLGGNFGKLMHEAADALGFKAVQSAADVDRGIDDSARLPVVAWSGEDYRTLVFEGDRDPQQLVGMTPLCRLTDAQARLAEKDARIAQLERQLQAAPAERGVPEQALRDMMRGYVVLLELARDKIVGLGGNCDPVSVMEAQDPWLRDARKVLESLNPAQATADSDVREVSE